MQGAAPESGVDVVQRGHEAGACFGFFVAQAEAQLFGGVALQVHEHHARLGVLVAGTVDVPDDGTGQFGQVAGVAAGGGQGDGAVGAVLLVVLPERAGADEGHQLAGLAVLFAQLLRGARGEFADRFEQVGQFGHRLAE